MENTHLLGPSYVLGEREADHTEIANLAELASRFKLSPQPTLWGWGAIRTTGRELEDLAVETGLASLRSAGLAPGAIDALVLCSNRIPGPAEGHGEFVAKVLEGTGLRDVPAYGVNLNRCVNLLAGIDIARAFVVSGRYQRVLVITTDKVAADADRMSQFALYSDGAASCVITSGRGAAPKSAPTAGGSGGSSPRANTASFELLGCATAQETASLGWTNQISADLAKDVNDRLLAEPGRKLGDLAALLHANLFTPLVAMKERQAGFDAGQLYLGNIPRIGHCFAADPLINLVDRVALGHIPAGAYCMLAASVPGSRIGVLLRRK
jgi:3-oxoacyl-[acyl-carrier-protein] synthase-3